MKMPPEYRLLVQDGFRGLGPWSLVPPEQAEVFRREYQVETGEDFLPFARRHDQDDVAGFRVVDGQALSAVVTVHLTWSRQREGEGFPSRSEQRDALAWLCEVAIPHAREWLAEELLEEEEEDDDPGQP